MSAPTPRTPNYKLYLTVPDHRGWQDEYYENMRILDSGLSSVTAIQNFQGAWLNSTVYAVGMVVTDSANGLLYRCVTAHTSAVAPTTFAQDRAAHPTYWGAYSFGFTYRGAWAPSTLYNVGDFITYGHIYAVTPTSHVSGPTYDTAYWEELIDATATVNAAQASANASAASANASANSAAAAEASAQSVGSRLVGTSTTPLNWTLGPATLTTQTAEGWAVGNYVCISLQSAPIQFMSGVVTAYNPSTGVMNVTIDYRTLIVGSGTPWNITLGGRPGGSGAGGTSMTSGTSAHTSVPANAASVVLLAANLNRIGATIFNESSSPVSVKLAPAVTASDYTLRMAGMSYYELPFGWTGAISGVWDTPVGSAHVVEYTP